MPEKSDAAASKELNLAMKCSSAACSEAQSRDLLNLQSA